MQSVLAALEAFDAQAEAVFSQIDAACSEAEVRLGTLEGRLHQATSRIEASVGSTRPLVLRNARSFGAQAELARKDCERVFSDGLLESLVVASPLPSAATNTAPGLKQAVEELARATQCVAPSTRSSADAGGGRGSLRQLGGRSGQLLEPRGRLGCTQELFLFNSPEQPYLGDRKEVNNLASPWEESDHVYQPAEVEQQGTDSGVQLNLEEEEASALEDLRFRPGPASEVTFDLPDSLPDLGGPVANIMWRQQDQAGEETERPDWDKPQDVFRLPRGSTFSTASPTPSLQPQPSPELPATFQPITITPQPQSPAAPAVGIPNLFQPPQARAQAPAQAPAQPQLQPQPQSPVQPPPQPHAAAAAAAPPAPLAAPSPPAQPAPQPKAETASKGAPPPPPPAAKGKGKGKGKGKPGPPPPPSKPKAQAPEGQAAAAASTAAPKPSAAAAGGKAAMFAAIRGGASLKKVAKPKERSGAMLGRVVS